MTTALPRARRVSARTAMLPAHGRRHNLSLVLQMLYSIGAMSRADLARRLGMSKVTVSDLVAELIESGHAVELGPSDQVRPGKPATLVDVNRTGLQAIGVDLAAHEVLRAAVLDLDGNILVRAERPIADDTGEAIVERVLELVHEVVAAATAPILGIGVGTPGIVVAGGVVDTAPNLGWRDVPLRDLIADATGLPVFVVNDADAAVHADYTLGNGGDDLVLVKIGRGVGCGLIVGGQRVRGAHFAAGEIGHVTVGTDGGPTCACGKVGCLEAWLAVPALTARLAAASDDEARIGILRDAGERLGIALAPIVGVLDVSEIVLSGPPELLDGPLAQATVETLRARTLAEFHDGVRVRMTEQGQDIVLRGAAVMVLSGQLGVS